MGPRLFSRGNAGQDHRRVVPDRRFNGAAAFQPRKPALLSSVVSGDFLASMGPRLFSRGNNRARAV